MGLQRVGYDWLTFLFSLVVTQHLGSSPIRDQTLVSYIGRQILYHWTTREAPNSCFLSALCQWPSFCSTLANLSNSSLGEGHPEPWEKEINDSVIWINYKVVSGAGEVGGAAGWPSTLPSERCILCKLETNLHCPFCPPPPAKKVEARTSLWDQWSTSPGSGTCKMIFAISSWYL